MSEKEIVTSLHKETRMLIFSWGGDIDTIMKPIDSIRYYKSFLQASMMSMTPQTGEVKAWVGGIDYKHFKYDMVRKGKRQTGSEIGRASCRERVYMQEEHGECDPNRQK